MTLQKQMYNPVHRESGREKLKDAVSFLNSILIVIGILGMLISIDKFAIAVKPATDFEGLLNTPVRPGDHIEGRVLYSYGCFAEASVISAQNGRKTGERKNGYYYAVPGRNSVLILKVPLRYQTAMESLTEETFSYLNGGAEPRTNAQVNGYVVRNDSESLQRMLSEYLRGLGFTGEEIEKMGEIYIVEQYDPMTQMRNLFLGSVIALAAGLIMLLIRRREGIAVFFGKSRHNLSPEKEALLGNMLVQVSVDRKCIAKQMASFLAVGLVIASVFSYFKCSQGYLPGSVILAYAAAVLFGLCPLTGSRAYIIFYEHGMNYCGEAFLYEEAGYPDFQVIPRKDGKLTVFLKLKNRIFNVSNMENFMEKYKRAYSDIC